MKPGPKITHGDKLHKQWRKASKRYRNRQKRKGRR